MTHVPWIPLQTSWPRHRKTLRLRSLLGTAEPIISLWCWAAENATNGDLTGFSVDEIEHAADWRGEPGKAFEAMCSAGFIDNVPANSVDGVSANQITLHEWGDTAGARISSYLQRNKKQRDLMRTRRSGSAGSGDSDPTQEEVREKREGNTLALTPSPPRGEPGKPTPYNVVSMYLNIRKDVIGGSVGCESVFARPQPSELDKAEKWLAGMTAEEAKYLEPAIRLACQHVVDGKAGWTHEAMTKAGFLLGSIVNSWRDLVEELQGCAPSSTSAADPKPTGRSQGGLSPALQARKAELEALIKAKTEGARQ